MSTTLEAASPSANTSGAKSVTAYLNFDGRCEEALEFYKTAVGATVTSVMRFSQSPGGPPGAPTPPPDKIMHSSFEVGETTVMATDAECAGKEEFHGTSLALTATDDDAAQRMFNALSADGKIEMPMSETFFASRFGMCYDKFGVRWMIISGARE